MSSSPANSNAGMGGPSGSAGSAALPSASGSGANDAGGAGHSVGGSGGDGGTGGTEVILPPGGSGGVGGGSTEGQAGSGGMGGIPDMPPAGGAAGGENPGGAGSDGERPRLCILPLGDSITQSNADHLSYRYWLWEALNDAGYEFDFVGSTNTNFSGSPNFPSSDFDRDHEGHWGWRADEIIAQLPGWLNSYTPDVVLMHLGTNDAFQSNSTDSTMDELSQVIAQLRSKNPAVVVLLAKLIPATQNQAQLDAINSNIDGLASELSTTESKVVVVDQASGFNVGSDQFDGIHPNEGGEKKMATKWFDALVENWPTSGGACNQ